MRVLRAQRRVAGQRAADQPARAACVSLQERQMEMLAPPGALELKIVDMIPQRPGGGHRRPPAPDMRDAAGRSASDVARGDGAAVKHEFLIPRPAVRLWARRRLCRPTRRAQPVSEDIKSFSASLGVPYCGLNSGFEASHWLDEAAERDVDRAAAAAPWRRRGPAEHIRPAGARLARPGRATAPTWAPSSWCASATRQRPALSRLKPDAVFPPPRGPPQGRVPQCAARR